MITIKTIIVQVPGSGAKHEATIQPGTTAEEVLEFVDLPDYNLRRPGSDDVNDTFGSDENVYDQVEDGQILQAGSDSPVGE